MHHCVIWFAAASNANVRLCIVYIGYV